MYKKHRAFVLTPKFCAYLQSPPNIKFDVFNKKDKSKILYLAKCQNRSVVLILCPTFLILNVDGQLPSAAMLHKIILEIHFHTFYDISTSKIYK